ncbi:Very-long-chain 3-oxoacyl-CoA reductase [Candida viswanathii]|uniref:Very-long-chain 3-oxoacyl-CoA reductase n=1 Tax=Candida viswanathii TaxID=5486 RepID=A0A367XZW9_9ASCO|nr:Very-long-chain 3-oxoacyl-CoA reductase [Candida viswanathii]
MSFTQFFNEYSDNTLVQVGLIFALLIGVFNLTIFSLKLGSLIYDIFIARPVDFSKYGAGNGKWAVVTGASDGIGKEYALQLAKKGLSIVLVSRTQSKLELIAKEIETAYKVNTKIVAFDASTDEEENYLALEKAVFDLPVTVLINNVGQSHSIPVPFLETTKKELRDIVTINNLATLKITQVVAPAIVATIERSQGLQKGLRGLILTMGSFGGLLPTPYLATYSGSKAFLQSWSAALAGELAPEGVDVELVISYLVASAMSKIKRSSATIPNPKQFVKSALSSVGRRGGAQDRYATSTPYWTHALMEFGIENTVGVYSKLANKLNLQMHQSIRARALKKAARLAAAEGGDKKD